ncbi:MAG: c-type cytochrome domain-containing protein [Planctomycetaceae bacterium]
MKSLWLRLALFASVAVFSIPANSPAQEEKPAGELSGISFYRKIRPVLQRRCSGCHQPAKAGGELRLTSFEGFLKGGENGAGFVAGKPDESLVMNYITGDPPQMPLNDAPLSPEQIELIRQWIAEGAHNDTPESITDTISEENPPIYQSAPVVSALAYSPDGTLLAVSGFREILVHKADGSGMAARLIGRSQRIESLAFSPDGKILAAVGGTPSLFGEVQFWDVETKKLTFSGTFANETLFGGSFSDDGTKFAFGGGDNSARVLNVADGKQIMRSDAHSDYVLGTTFSLQLDHLITVSRDMAMKLLIIENGQFVDNITSITPGALKGGLTAVQRHPTQENVLIGGADGEPKLYQIFRTQKRVIGDDFNRIRGYPVLPGRIYSLQFNADGTRFVVGASTAVKGTARICDTEAGTVVHELKGISTPVYAVAYRPGGKEVAVAGFDGIVRFFNAETGEAVREQIPVTITPTVAGQ